MSRPMHRRQFLRTVAASSGALALTGSVRTVLAGAATIPGPGPYGALSPTADGNGFFLPAGFTSRLLAVSGLVVGSTGYTWHANPDAGGCFPIAGGGWVYVSNSEVSNAGGGAGALRFDANGQIVAAYSILTGTSRNCSGGQTVAGTWLSGEENGAGGKVYECTPQAPSQGVARPALGLFSHEAAVEDPIGRAVYLTEDDPAGRLYRFVPTVAGNLSAGRLFAASVLNGTVTWVPASSTAPDRQSSTTAFNGGEGLWIEGRSLYFTTKGDVRVWLLDLDTNALSVVHDGIASPTTALNAVDQCAVHRPSGDLFVCEDGGNMEVGVIAASSTGALEVAAFLRITGHSASEWTGLAFSPDHRRMYVTSQRGTDGVHGRTYEITGPFRTVSRPAAPETLIASGSTWRYLVTATAPATTWKSLSFSDAAWPSGVATLGYGDPVSTTIGFGPDANNKYVTTYLRRTFTATHGYSSMKLLVRRDDGVVVHINGVEVARNNMPAGVVSGATLASTALGGADETAYLAIPIAPTLYLGTNVVAVEVHQSTATSSDLVFDLALQGNGNTGTLPPPPGTVTTTIGITDDAHVRDGSSQGSRFGTATTAQVQTSTAGNNRWYYLKAATATHTGKVSRAVVRVNASCPSAVALSLWAVPSTSWAESTITWANRPARGAVLASASVAGPTAAWIEFDVTAYVAAERAAGRTNVAFCIAAPATSALVTIASAESTTTALRPRLVITA